MPSKNNGKTISKFGNTYCVVFCVGYLYNKLGSPLDKKSWVEY